jgi:hypothetical protein
MNGGAVAAAAAAAKRRREQWEEEEMTGYTPEELASGSEFKILRSATSGFKRPEFLRQVLDEEKAAGWMLVEKFDDSRIRLKRPASARADGTGTSTTFDPYRSYVGISEVALGLRIAAAIAIGLAVVLGVIAAFARGS